MPRRTDSNQPASRNFPDLLAEALDIVDTAEYDLPAAAKFLQVSSSQLVKFLKLEPRALRLVNTQRQRRGFRPLR